MKDYVAEAKKLRAQERPHYNCCQAVMGAFATEMGLSQEQVRALGAHFGLGMRCGSACGVVSGALQTLGALGKDEKEATAFLQQFKEKHGAVDCPTLLALSRQRGEAPRSHCDGLIFEAVAYLGERTQQHE